MSPSFYSSSLLRHEYKFRLFFAATGVYLEDAQGEEEEEEEEQTIITPPYINKLSSRKIILYSHTTTT